MSNKNIYLNSKAWPFVEAKALLQRVETRIQNSSDPNDRIVRFETGYGPSGLPHIGTFGEVARTTMVRNAFRAISDLPTKLICISDDMDGMRKIPDTIPNKSEYLQYMDQPLSKIPDPFKTNSSFGANMNARLRKFLDHFGFDYDFYSASECYQNGTFNQGLQLVLKHYDEIMDIMLPTLGEERQQTYSPFLPVCKKTGKVLQVPIQERDLAKNMISYKDPETNQTIETSILDGNCKLQWKVDFGMRWAIFKIDFEMYGKDHLVNGKIYSAICKAIGGNPPQQMFFELFLDHEGKKISKSKGNGLTIDEWLRYAPQESLALFMYNSPQKAKKLYFDVIPKAVDEYLQHLHSYHSDSDEAKRVNNPVFHIHAGKPPIVASRITYSLILNLVSACNTDNPEVIWGYIGKLFTKADAKSDTKADAEAISNHRPNGCPFLESIVQGAIRYYQEHIKPYKKYRSPSQTEKSALKDLRTELNLAQNSKFIDFAEEMQNLVYTVAQKHQIEVKDWFKALYEILLGAESGPRFGSFIALYGISDTIKLIDNVIAE